MPHKRDIGPALRAALTVEPTSYVFNKTYEGNLQQRLKEHENGTQLNPILDGNGVLLNYDGTTVGTKHRYTTVAFSQLCLIIAGGLASLLADLSGRHRKPEQNKAEFGLRIAVDIFNQVVRFRKNRLRDRQLVRFLPGKTIDGIVSPAYRYLSNLGFYDRVQSAVGSTAEFYEALLYGRYLVLRYILPDQRFIYNTGGPRVESFVTGFHFVNSEIGEGSARAAVLLVRESTGETCISPFVGRVRHQGKDFDAKIAKLMLNVSGHARASEQHRERIGSLLASKLHFGQGDKSDEKRKRAIVATLVKHGLPQFTAEKVVTATLLIGDGNYTGDPTLIQRQHLVLASRTAYDVFTALMREGHGFAVEARENVEQVAYALLTGRFHFE